MPKIIHNIFLIYLPRLLCIKTIDEEEKSELVLKRLSVMDSGFSTIKNLSSMYEQASSYNEKDSFNIFPLKIKPKHPKAKKTKPVKKVQCKKFQELVLENIFYLNEIINFMQNDSKGKKVISKINLKIKLIKIYIALIILR